jgi:hypothetical protein
MNTEYDFNLACRLAKLCLWPRKGSDHHRTLQRERSPGPRQFFPATDVPASRFEEVKGR